ncbi:tyrosine-type recombinase/integrase [Vicingus serpentipes]|uniref:Tyrosine-type recombinase/integrase n=1 Tax=Vicingus serpentipes TaxID=1926625 RepID=A0A5C6RXM0_9FLAO|nr:tyrosine-type recombinase/integrase [Vicingus serpentipes]TXB66857.1 tyrosine-type recombinase/integrase [Vicingus serpentipes]
MATVNYRLVKIKTSSKSQIHVYISLGRGNVILKKTGFTISPNDWSTTTKRPKQNDAHLKNLFNKLNKLSNYIYEQINEAEIKGEIINSFWLENVIDTHFNRLGKINLNNNLLTTQIEYIIDNANTRKIKGTSKVGLSQNRIKGYVTFFNLILRYEKHLKCKIRLTDINNSFVDKFTNWLMNKENYSINYSGKMLDNLKTICLDAKKRGIKINDFAPNIESFKEIKKDKDIITLSFDELEIIRNKELTKDHLINVRKWLLIGCEIGQRGGDLLNLTKDNLRYIENNLVIDITQQKTGKNVTIPIYKDYIEYILTKEFPYKISNQKFNQYLKDLCKECNINEVVSGKKYDNKKKRKVSGNFPKYELITSHSLRRSFATNYYKHIPTPILIEITGHSKESMFLEYIGKPKDKDENAKLFLKLVKEMNNKTENNLKAV